MITGALLDAVYNDPCEDVRYTAATTLADLGESEEIRALCEEVIREWERNHD